MSDFSLNEMSLSNVNQSNTTVVHDNVTLGGGGTMSQSIQVWKGHNELKVMTYFFITDSYVFHVHHNNAAGNWWKWNCYLHCFGLSINENSDQLVYNQFISWRYPDGIPLHPIHIRIESSASILAFRFNHVRRRMLRSSSFGVRFGIYFSCYFN